MNTLPQPTAPQVEQIGDLLAPGGNERRHALDFSALAHLAKTGMRVVLHGAVRLLVLALRLALGVSRVAGLLGIAGLAIAHAVVLRVVVAPTAVAMAHARAKWLHRWSRAVRWMLGLRLDQHGFTPVSGIVTANYTMLLDAILLASVRPCVFVAGAGLSRRPFIGRLARIGGTLFIDPARRNDLSRVNFSIERAVQRRLLVVIFPECGRPGESVSRGFASALFQPAAELGCSLTASVVTYRTLHDGETMPSAFQNGAGGFRQLAHLLTRWHPRASSAFSGPAFHRGDRKELARQLRQETLDLQFHLAGLHRQIS